MEHLFKAGKSADRKNAQRTSYKAEDNYINAVW